MHYPTRQQRIAPAPETARNLTERDIALIWNAQSLPTDRALFCRDGRSVQVVYRGRWSYGYGPDFGAAMIALDGRLQRGDVEIHLKSGGWQSHGHDTDPRYNSVVLHVIAYRANDTALGVRCADGTDVPTLALDDFFTAGELALALRRAEAQGSRLGTYQKAAGHAANG